MSEQIKQAAWSFATSFLVAFVPLLIGTEWTWAALGAAALAAARTAIAALNPKSKAFGVGARNYTLAA